jgi:LysR family hca operon transcriptional activator
LVSLCSGAFILAATGLLAGSSVSTHHHCAETLAKRFPEITVDTNQRIIDDGDIITAGGFMSWVDVGLLLIDRILGGPVALETARFIFSDAAAGEARYFPGFAPKESHGDTAVLKAQEWVHIRDGREISLASMAAAGLERRTFLRRFAKATGMTPIEYCRAVRIARARELLESGNTPQKEIAQSLGYEDVASFARVFRKVTGSAPGDYRRRFGLNAVSPDDFAQKDASSPTLRIFERSCSAWRLHTAQPSLSRQIGDLETEVGAQLLVRSARGIELTAGGRGFLDHARLALSQVEAAGEAARRAAQPAKTSFVMGFLTGIEMDWFPEAERLFRNELPDIEVILVSQRSPDLANALLRGKVDVAFLRPELGLPNLAFKHLTREPLVVVLPSDHRLAALEVISPRDFEGETFVNVARTAPTLRAVIDNYLGKSDVIIATAHEIASVSAGVSLIASTRGVALMPGYAVNLLPQSVVSRPLAGRAPTIDLVLGYHKANTSRPLKLFLSRTDDLIARVSKRCDRLLGSSDASALANH